MDTTEPLDEEVERAVARLRPHAAHGVPTIEQLQSDFEKLLGDVAWSQASAPVTSGLTMFREMGARVSEGVVQGAKRTLTMAAGWTFSGRQALSEWASSSLSRSIGDFIRPSGSRPVWRAPSSPSNNIILVFREAQSHLQAGNLTLARDRLANAPIGTDVQVRWWIERANARITTDQVAELLALQVGRLRNEAVK